MEYSGLFSMTQVMFYIVPLFIGLVFVFMIAMAVSPKLRGKLMSNRVKGIKYMTDYSKDDLENIGTTVGNIIVNTKNNINGTGKDNIYCKYCGESIDKDSVYCNKCGNKL